MGEINNEHSILEHRGRWGITPMLQKIAMLVQCPSLVPTQITSDNANKMFRQGRPKTEIDIVIQSCGVFSTVAQCIRIVTTPSVLLDESYVAASPPRNNCFLGGRRLRRGHKRSVVKNCHDWARLYLFVVFRALLSLDK